MASLSDFDSLSLTPFERIELRTAFDDGIACIYHIQFPLHAFHIDVENIPDPNTNWIISSLNNIPKKEKPKEIIILSKNQEQKIFLKYNWLKWRMGKDIKNDGPDYVILARLREKNKLRAKLTGYNLALILKLVKDFSSSSFFSSNVRTEDLVSEGTCILLNAIDKFDVSTGYKFSTYLYLSINRAFHKLSNKHAKYTNIFPTSLESIAEKNEGLADLVQGCPLDCSLKSRCLAAWTANYYVECPYTKKNDHSLEIMRSIIRKNSAKLSVQELDVIRRRYRPGDAKSPTLEILGKETNQSKSNLSRLERLAIRKIKTKFMEEINR